MKEKNLISKIFEGDKSIKVDEHAGLLVDFMAKNSCGILIKGLRDVKDFSEEMTYSLQIKTFKWWSGYNFHTNIRKIYLCEFNFC